MHIHARYLVIYLFGLSFFAGLPDGLSQESSADDIAAAPMQKLAFTLGTYEGVSEMPNGRLYRVRMQSDWWIEGHSIAGQSWDAFDDGEWRPFYKGFQNWHGGREQVVFQSSGRDGEYVYGHITAPDARTVFWYWTIVMPDGRSRTGRDTWAFNEDRSAFLWTFANETQEGGYEPYFEISMKRTE